MTPLTREQVAYLVQFIQPEKTLALLPGAANLNDALLARLFDLGAETYGDLKRTFAEDARRAATDLLADDGFAAAVDALPFAPGEVVVGLGDSITAERRSWLEILRHALELRRPDDHLQVVNAGVSGDTTTQMVARFAEVVALKPQWIVAKMGTNDARRHGRASTKPLVSLEETARNLELIRHYAATETGARWVWLTPATVIEAQIEEDWFLSSAGLSWRAEELSAVAEQVLNQPDPVVDLRDVLGRPAQKELLLSDGLHPSLEGQKAILRRVVRALSQLPRGRSI